MVISSYLIAKHLGIFYFILVYKLIRFYLVCSCNSKNYYMIRNLRLSKQYITMVHGLIILGEGKEEISNGKGKKSFSAIILVGIFLDHISFLKKCILSS